MGMTYNVFMSDIDDSKIPEWIGELNKLGMECNVHPEFSFKTQTGFLPFRIKIEKHTHEALMNKEFLTGFEYYLDGFNLEEHTEYLKQSLFDRLLMKPKERGVFHSRDIDEKLKNMKYVVTFNFGVADTFELRMASLGVQPCQKLPMDSVVTLMMTFGMTIPISLKMHLMMYLNMKNH